MFVTIMIYLKLYEIRAFLHQLTERVQSLLLSIILRTLIYISQKKSTSLLTSSWSKDNRKFPIRFQHQVYLIFCASSSPNNKLTDAVLNLPKMTSFKQILGLSLSLSFSAVPSFRRQDLKQDRLVSSSTISCHDYGLIFHSNVKVYGQ